MNLLLPGMNRALHFREPEIVPEIIRKAFIAAQAEKPGGSFIDVPENVAAMQLSVDKEPFKVQSAQAPVPPADKILPW